MTLIAEQGSFEMDVVTLDLEGEYLNLARERKELEERIDTIKTQLTKLEPQLMEYWLGREKRNEKRGGGEIYLYRGRFALTKEGVTEDQLCAALQDTEMRDLVKFGVNKNSLTARLKEAEDQGGIPETLADVVELTPRFSIRYRGAR